MQNPLLSIITDLFRSFVGRKVSEDVPLEQINQTPLIHNHWLRFERHRSGDDGITAQVLLYNDHDKAMIGRVSESLLQIKVRPIEQGDHKEVELGGYVIVARITDHIRRYSEYTNVHGINLLSFLHSPVGVILSCASNLTQYVLRQYSDKDPVPGDNPGSGE